MRVRSPIEEKITKENSFSNSVDDWVTWMRNKWYGDVWYEGREFDIL